MKFRTRTDLRRQWPKGTILQLRMITEKDSTIEAEGSPASSDAGVFAVRLAAGETIEDTIKAWKAGWKMTSDKLAGNACSDCGQPMPPPGEVKRPNEYDHASGCLSARRTPKLTAFEREVLGHISRGVTRHNRHESRARNSLFQKGLLTDIDPADNRHAIGGQYLTPLGRRVLEGS